MATIDESFPATGRRYLRPDISGSQGVSRADRQPEICSLLKKGTGSEPMAVNTAKNGRREVPVPLFQSPQKEKHPACIAEDAYGRTTYRYTTERRYGSGLRVA
jgi:hypothetical protein